MTRIRSRSSGRIREAGGSGGGGGFGIPGLGGGGGGLGIPMKAGGGILGLIVVLAAVLLPRLMGGSQGLATSDPGPAPAAEGEVQCDTEIEEILCGAVDDVSEYWIDEYPRRFGGQYQEADTVFFSGAVGTGCGQASSQMGPFYCPADGLVYFDTDFLLQMQQQFGAVGDLAAQYIVAHEYGHHVQNVLGVSSQVSRLQQAEPGPGQRPVRQARTAGGLPRRCVGPLGRSSAACSTRARSRRRSARAAAVGDDRIQEGAGMSVDPDSFTHGTSEQRVQWFRRGYDTGDPNRCNTFDEL